MNDIIDIIEAVKNKKNLSEFVSIEPIQGNLDIDKNIVVEMISALDLSNISNKNTRDYYTRLLSSTVSKIIKIHKILSRVKTDYIKAILYKSATGTLVEEQSLKDDSIYTFENIERNQVAKRYFILVGIEEFPCLEVDTVCDAFPFYLSSGINSGRPRAWLPYKSFTVNIEKNVDFPYFLKNPLVNLDSKILDIIELDTDKIENTHGTRKKTMRDMIQELKSKNYIASTVIKNIEKMEKGKTITLVPYRYQYSFEFMFISFILGGYYWNSDESEMDRKLLTSFLELLQESITLKDLEDFQLEFNPKRYKENTIDLFNVDINKDIYIRKKETKFVPQSVYFKEEKINVPNLTLKSRR